MLEEKVYIRALLLHYWKKGLSAAAASKEICAVEGEDTIAERTAQKWFKRFKNHDMDIEDNPRSGRPTIVDHEQLQAAVEENPGSSTQELADELGPSQSTIWRHIRML